MRKTRVRRFTFASRIDVGQPSSPLFLRSVPALDGTNVTFNGAGDVLYAVQV